MIRLTLCLIIFSFAFQSDASDDAWNIQKSTHFVVYYKGNLGDFAYRVMDKAEFLYEKITDYLGFRRENFWLWDNRAKIYIYENADQYRTATSQPAWSSGCASVKEKVIKTYYQAKNFFDNVLPHEMAHIIFREFVGFYNPAIPLWLEEGIASFQEEAKRSVSRRILFQAMQDKGFMNLKELNNFNPDSRANAELVNLFYAEAMSIVDFLIKEFGQDSFLGFSRILRDKKNFTEAMIRVYQFKDIEELDMAWQNYLRNE